MVSGSDVIQVEDEYLEMILNITVHRLQLKEGGKVFADSSRQLNQFYKLLQTRIKFTGWKSPVYRLLTGPVQ